MISLCKHIPAVLLGLMATACGPSVPGTFTDATDAVKISPDYQGLTIPVNIAPLNFSIEAKGEGYITHIYTRNDAEGLTLDGQTIDIPVKKWHKLLVSAQGDTVFTDIYVKGKNGWTRYPRLWNAVADSIDPYISYRLIEPSYISFEEMAICQRSLGDFHESEILNNTSLSTEKEGQCMNCHSYQNYNRAGNMQLHIRVRKGGTVIVHDGDLKKINLKNGGLISSGVYPSWHPTEPMIAYSVNTTSQSFHTRDINKVEVQDAASDLILYDAENDRSYVIANDSTELETFPYWSPDGRSLWYVSAKVPPMTDKEMELYQCTNFKDFRYDLYRRSFDPKSMTFGPADTTFRAAAGGRSITLPRPSPDGRWLLVTAGEFGTFHIWHRDADLWLLDTHTGAMRPLEEVNSPDVESYHSWSSNGRWIIFSSRRGDGSYTRLYITHFDKNGRASKPFPLPQRTPEFDRERLKSYNIPEFMAAPVEISKRELVKVIENDPINVPLQK